MNLKDFTSILKDNGNYDTNSEAKTAINAFVTSIADVLDKGESVTVPGLGTFKTESKKATSGTIPGTDKKWNKPAHTAPKFTVSSSLKHKISGL